MGGGVPLLVYGSCKLVGGTPCGLQVGGLGCGGPFWCMSVVSW